MKFVIVRCSMWRVFATNLHVLNMYFDARLQHIFRVSVICKHEHTVTVCESGKNVFVEGVIQFGVVGGCSSQPVSKMILKLGCGRRILFVQ